MRAGDNPPMSADAQAARDRDTHLSYALQLADGEPERITTELRTYTRRRRQSCGAGGSQSQSAMLAVRTKAHMH